MREVHTHREKTAVFYFAMALPLLLMYLAAMILVPTENKAILFNEFAYLTKRD